ncbi:serine O-acetyltransferase [Sphingomonas sp. R86520]|uniref:serine O-acetyltransferase n=1 Tax=Sphingomonas sp. R86520 TaxID=3093859 RepID=UPI0036D2E347
MSLNVKIEKYRLQWQLYSNKAENDLIEKYGLIGCLWHDFRTHDLDWSLPGFRAIATYRFGTWARTISLRPARQAILIFHLYMFRLVRNRYGIELYLTSQIGRGVRFGHQNGIVIHRFARIGDRCLIRQGVTFGEGGLNKDNFADKIGPVVGNDVDIGAGAVLIGNVKIGDRVHIGPNAVVITDIPADATVFAPMSKIISRVRPAENNHAPIPCVLHLERELS